MADDQDNPGINVPPPLIYLLALLLGLLLDRRAHLPFRTGRPDSVPVEQLPVTSGPGRR